jgi:hypothetical protein
MTLRATLEIIPFGDETKAREIVVLNISNVTFKEGRGPNGEDTYVVEVNDYKNYDSNTKRIFHKREDGAVALVEKACRNV